MIQRIALLALAPLLAACSDNAEAPKASASSAAPVAAVTPAAAATPAAPAASKANVLALEGFDELVIGEPVPAGSSFQARGAQVSDQCLIYTSPDHPGMYALVEDGELRRVTVGERSPVKLVEGIGAGASEQEVLAAFPGFRASPHEYVAAPGKYLTQPGSDPRLMFEIDAAGRVSAVHVGLMPQLGYVESCA